LAKRVGCELFLHDENAKTFYNTLHAQKDEIEKELGYSLQWQELKEKKGCRIAVYLNGSFENEEDRQKLIEWCYQKANDFYRVFNKRIQNL